MDAVRHCDVCRFTGETAHAYSVHMKGMPHLRAVEKAEERRALVAEETNKDEARERFARQWQQTMQPLCESYIEAVQLTVGGIHERPRMPACNTLSESIAAVYELSRPRAHVVARRKALYKFVFRVCKGGTPLPPSRAPLTCHRSAVARRQAGRVRVDSAQAGLGGL